MSPSSRSARRHSAALALLLTASSSVAFADSKKAECATAYEKSQEHRAKGRLHSAEEGLLVCSNEECPAFIRTDCTQWLGEVRREQPTLVFTVKDKKGEDTSSVTITMDGEPFSAEGGGKSVAVDPGKHQFVFELDGEKLEREVTARKGEKDREILVNFAPEEPEAPVGNPYGDTKGETGTEEAAAEDGKAGPLRPYAYIAGGVGVAGIAGFVILGAMGKSKQSELDGSCGKTHSCPQSDVDGIKTKYILADVSLGVGIAGLGAGVALFVLSMPKTSQAKSDEARVTELAVRPTPGGGVATVGGTF